MARTLFNGLGQPPGDVGLTAALLAQGENLGLMAEDFTRLHPAYDAVVESLTGAGPE